MKRLLKNSIFVCIFTFALLLCGVGVKAANGIDNTTVSGDFVSYKIDGNNYYALKGNAQESKLVLKAKSTGRYTKTWFVQTFKVYTAQVTVVKCDDFDTSSQYCKTWSTYNYSSDANKTMDALKQSGLTLSFKDELFTPAKGITEINGAKLSTLVSEHKMTDIYFVIVQYRLQTGDLYDPDIFRVVFADDMQALSLSSNDLGDTVKVTATSGVPVASIRYFYTSTQLENGYDFNTEYTKSGNGVENSINLKSAPSSNNGIFNEVVSLQKGENKYFYVEATDALGNRVTMDVNNNAITENAPSNQVDQNTNASNVGNTNVGKIILFSLLVILVISLVLVIVQRIIDYKRKLY